MWAVTSLVTAALVAIPAGAQNFGAQKEKVTLQRKLPALVHLPGTPLKSPSREASLTEPFPTISRRCSSLELLKDDPDLREDDSPNTIITCRITEYSGPVVTTTTGPALALTKGSPTTQQFQRITGTLTIAFQTKTPTGQTLISDNISAKYDQEFDSSGNSASHGVLSRSRARSAA